MPMFWGSSYGWPMMIGMVFAEIFWLLVLSLAIVAIFTRFRRHRPMREMSALEILRQRYARGEIDTATFEQMRDHLNEMPARTPGSERWPQD